MKVAKLLRVFFISFKGNSILHNLFLPAKPRLKRLNVVFKFIFTFFEK